MSDSLSSISSLSGSAVASLATGLERQTMGAQVVTKTLDYMNGGGSSLDLGSSITDKQTFGAAVVVKTMDYMNSGSSKKSGNSLFDLNKDVLGAHTTGKVLDFSI